MRKNKVKVYDLIEENHGTFSLCDETGTCPQVKTYLKLHAEVSFLGCPYTTKDEQNPVIEIAMNFLEKLEIINKGLAGYSSTVLPVKKKTTEFVEYFLNDKLVTINHAFQPVHDCIQTIH